VRLLIPGAVILAAILDHYGLERASVTAGTVREGMIRACLARPKAWWRLSCYAWFRWAKTLIHSNQASNGVLSLILFSICVSDLGGLKAVIIAPKSGFCGFEFHT